MAKRNPDVQYVDPNAISKSEFMALLQDAVKRAGSASRVALLLGANERSVLRWLRGEGPSAPKMAVLYVNIKNINWNAALDEIQAIRQRSQSIQ